MMRGLGGWVGVGWTRCIREEKHEIARGGGGGRESINCSVATSVLRVFELCIREGTLWHHSWYPGSISLCWNGGGGGVIYSLERADVSLRVKMSSVAARARWCVLSGMISVIFFILSFRSVKLHYYTRVLLVFLFVYFLFVVLHFPWMVCTCTAVRVVVVSTSGCFPLYFFVLPVST